jgi:uncharacterized membrane protein
MATSYIAEPGFAAVPATHRVHVILSAYPIACFTGALVTDIVYARSDNMMWANFSAWLIAAGLVMGALAALAGIVDFLIYRRRRPGGWLHGIGSIVMLFIALANELVHSRDAYTSVVPTGLTLSAIVALLVLVLSWLGSRRVVAPVAPIAPQAEEVR